MDVTDVVKLTSRAWSLEILRLMHDGVPGRQAQLLAASGAGRTAFAQSLRHLVELGHLERNPGHGHPLRPEYRLTEQGAQMAALSRSIDAALGAEAQAPLLRRAWTVPVLTVSRQPKFFSEIKGLLPPITDRALSQTLQALEQTQWLLRDTRAEMRPPRPVYRAQNTGARIAEAVQQALAA
ncbi:hypothetical protein AIOL_001074 [Candidatus Rhodobacter oscarellae]|uniref:HTH hxlR-type domain-containing protein n=1 Tax=Candidatus Rhodobacter oscarellae TaxID=1675527 RepID=A0A0J9E0G0_9RHOB|nr:winged helix-turn-helix transcriptional regulator [Candidatus Rhodobacter lobularis]KMW56122.1 hypothetical protein AIOL_001074 [Candidatus Rhodobacter lobularis]